MALIARRWQDLNIDEPFARRNTFTRLVVRWDPDAENYSTFLQLGCATILLRYLLSGF
jgi:hypothetical protein